MYLWVSCDCKNEHWLLPLINSINKLMFVTETGCVFFEVRSGFLNIIYINFLLERDNKINQCMPLTYIKRHQRHSFRDKREVHKKN
jgi:hypothetical protein